MAITSEQIIQLASGKGVRRIAVENFLGTIETNPNERAATQNLYADAASYRWNCATQNAIRRGIKIHFDGIRK